MSDPSLTDRCVVIKVQDDNGEFVRGSAIAMMLNDKVLTKADDITAPVMFQLNALNIPLRFVATYKGYSGQVTLAPDQYEYSIPLKGLKLPRPLPEAPFWERHLVFLFGCVLLSVGLMLVILFPRNVRPDLYKWFAITFALAAGGIASEIPGFLDLKFTPGQKLAIGASGAIAIFVILFFFNPA